MHENRSFAAHKRTTLRAVESFCPPTTPSSTPGKLYHNPPLSSQIHFLSQDIRMFFLIVSDTSEYPCTSGIYSYVHFIHSCTFLPFRELPAAQYLHLKGGKSGQVERDTDVDILIAFNYCVDFVSCVLCLCPIYSAAPSYLYVCGEKFCVWFCSLGVTRSFSSVMSNAPAPAHTTFNWC